MRDMGASGPRRLRRTYARSTTTKKKSHQGPDVAKKKGYQRPDRIHVGKGRQHDGDGPCCLSFYGKSWTPDLDSMEMRCERSASNPHGC
jgi:hypothetical protein